MKTRIPVILTALSLAATAQAGSLHLDLRADYNSTTYNDMATSTEALSDSARFHLRTGRMDYRGDLNEDITFRVRLAFNKSAALAAKDNTQTAVELAYLTQKFTDSFSLTLGKIDTEIGGFEGVTSSADLYLTSENFTRSPLARATAAANAGTNSKARYMTGVKGSFHFADQVVSLVATDNITDPSTGSQSSQNRGMLGLLWRGHFLEKDLKSVLSYFEVSPQDATVPGDSKQSYISAGLSYKMNLLVASLEHHISIFKDGASHDENKLTSWVAKLTYSGFEQWQPRLEFISSQDQRDLGQTTDTTLGYGVVLEYIPQKSEAFRYHIAANWLDQDREGVGHLTRTEVLVGTRLMADFLK